MSTETAARSTRNEWILLVTLATIQFTNVLDFVIMMPLGPQLMRIFGLNAQQFGLVVSSYTFSAGTTGFIAAFFIDRFDRRKALLVLYAGFTAGTFMCAIAPSYLFLVAARVTAGAFGGILGATVFAIVADVVPYARRGAATGMIMSSFSMATVIGVPTGMFLANLFSWHAPFFLLAANAAVMWMIAYRILPVMRTHMTDRGTDSAFRMVADLLRRPANIRAFIFMSLLVYAGFSVIPYIAPYLVANTGMPESQLALVYFFGGAATMFTSRWFGRLADRFGKKRIFAIIAVASTIPLLAVTNLPPVPVAITLGLTTLFMVLVSGRVVPAMALVTSMVEPRQRGSFMSLNSSVQQLASGLASVVSGTILVTGPGGFLKHYNVVGFLAVAVTLVCVWMARSLRTSEEESEPPQVRVPR